MRQLFSTVTVKGQVTIPVEVRRLLGVAPHDRVAFEVEGDDVRLKRSAGVVERTAGMFKTDQPPLTAEGLREAAERAISAEVTERMAR